ncbi:hypothetical protein GCM10010082_08080 [Kushneria pakistanensis]|uniref:Uncharacterized protein n=1 Tax=Kushneria pakistanensis TaxID=1508770 RepID=A0ABQ3FCX4_9GAMM|nr:DUF6586 family protein [Kushneria pakistanensis]GHC18997.1 hypothetical protein GCM10010082_08080 [Kushneria pakistanensis]
MSHQGRTNQLLYQAMLLLDQPAGNDEHADARHRALEEGALSMLEMALESVIREIAHTCRWPQAHWRTVLEQPPAPVAEIELLRGLMAQPESWLARLLHLLDRLHDESGAAQLQRHDNMIASSGHEALAQQLARCLDDFRALLPRLRETSYEW